MLRFAALILALFGSLLSGCSGGSSEPAPTTHPAKGKITDRSGQPVTGGMVELVSSDQITKKAMAQIGTDGTFELFVMDAEGNKHPGAEEGEYAVTFMPVMTAAQTEAPVKLPRLVKIQPGENTLDLKLP